MNGPLWTFDAFIAAIKGRPLGITPEAIAGISIDSRTLLAGDAFFAIKGDRFDGHDFVAEALAAGAGVAVVAKQRLAGFGKIEGSLVVVEDVLGALADLGRAAEHHHMHP